MIMHTCTFPLSKHLFQRAENKLIGNQKLHNMHIKHWSERINEFFPPPTKDKINLCVVRTWDDGY